MVTPLPDPGLASRPGESCGVFGVIGPDADAARLTYFGLFALQHRGQESAGISVSDGETITVVKDLGLVAQVFDEATLGGLNGHVAVGHTRYSTTGSAVWENSQPVYRPVGSNGIALAHNGNLTNTGELAESFEPTAATTDSELMTAAIAGQLEKADAGLPAALAAALPTFAGAFTLAVMDRNHLIGVRDPRGFRPLCLGKTGEAWVVASETAALDIVGAQFLREIEPGEMVVIGAEGPQSSFPFEETSPKLCLFEFVYFARPDSNIYGQNIHAARRRAGWALAKEAPTEADVVVPVPESGIPAAQGYAAFSGIPYVDGLVKNRYVGRTFIEPAQSMRDRGISMKLNPMPEELADRRVVLVDDSIVRGSTTRQLIEMVRDSGAKEVHLRISSPPYRWPCFYGMDTGDRSTLLAADRSVDEVAEFLGVDSLAHLTLDSLTKATGAPADGFCTACLSGEYPTDIPTSDGKYVLEQQS